MKEELSLREVISEVILFFIKFRILIISITMLGALSAIVFQKLRPAYYNTTAIATSGISVFERIEDTQGSLNQRTAINLINNLQIDIQKKDFVIVAEKLNVSKESAASIKSISAKHILREDKDNKDVNTPKFEILLSVKDNAIIQDIQAGLVYYFDKNKYISDFYNKFQITNNQEIVAVDAEILALSSLRNERGSNIDMSSFNLYSKKGIAEVQNQIIELIQLKSLNSTNQSLLKPLSFVQGFTVAQIPERAVLLLGSLAAFISFIISIIISIFINIKQSVKLT